MKHSIRVILAFPAVGTHSSESSNGYPGSGCASRPGMGSHGDLLLCDNSAGVSITDRGD